MTNPAYNKSKGAGFEIAVMKWFRAFGHTIERLRLSGKDDEGDLVLIVSGKPYVFECKNVQKLDLPKFWREASIEAENYAKARGLEVVPPSYIIAKRRNAGIEQSWVITTLEKWTEQIG